MAALLDGSDGGFDLFGTLPLLSRSPVQTAQTVEDCPANLILGVRLELDIMTWIEAVDRRDQPDRARRYEIVEINAFGQPVMYSTGDQFYLRQMLENQAFSFFYGILNNLISIHWSARRSSAPVPI